MEPTRSIHQPISATKVVEGQSKSEQVIACVRNVLLECCARLPENYLEIIKDVLNSRVDIKLALFMPGDNVGEGSGKLSASAFRMRLLEGLSYQDESNKSALPAERLSPQDLDKVVTAVSAKSFLVKVIQCRLEENKKVMQNKVQSEASLTPSINSMKSTSSQLKESLVKVNKEKSALQIKIAEVKTRIEAEKTRIEAEKNLIEAEKNRIIEAEKNEFQQNIQLESASKLILTPKFFNQGEIFNNGASEQQIWLVEALESGCHKKVDKTQILYSMDRNTKAGIYDYLQGVNNTVVLFQMTNGNICAVFSELAVDSATSGGVGLLMALWGRKVWDYQGDKKVISYDKSFICLGSSEIKIRNQYAPHERWEIQESLNGLHAKCYYANVEQFFGKGCSNGGKVEIKALEVHQVFFKDVNEKENEKVVVGEPMQAIDAKQRIKGLQQALQLRRDKNAVESKQEEEELKDVQLQLNKLKADYSNLPADYDKNNKALLILKKATFFKQGDIFDSEVKPKLQILYNEVNPELQSFYNAQQEYLVNTLEEKMDMPIVRTTLLYKLDHINKANIHQYVDEKNNVLLVYRMSNGRMGAGFSELAFSKGCDKVKGLIGLIMALWNNKVWEVDQTKSPIQYADEYLIFGNTDLRYKRLEHKIYSKFGSSQSSYQHNGAKIDELFGINAQEIEIEALEVYQVFFGV